MVVTIVGSPETRLDKKGESEIHFELGGPRL